MRTTGVPWDGYRTEQHKRRQTVQSPPISGVVDAMSVPLWTRARGDGDFPRRRSGLNQEVSRARRDRINRINTGTITPITYTQVCSVQSYWRTPWSRGAPRCDFR